VIVLLSGRDTRHPGRAVSRVVVEELSVDNPHINGHILHPADWVPDRPEATDVPEVLRVSTARR
jgi:hypothetical protein